MHDHENVIKQATPGEASRAASVHSSPDVIAILDADATIRYVSPSIEPVLGYQPEQLLGKNWFQYVHPDDALQAQPTFTRAAPPAIATRWSALRLRHADGSWINVESVGNNLLHHPSLRGWVVNARDLTPRGPTPPPAASPRRELDEEAEVSAALARVGREMISLLDTPALLNRLCRLATEVLDCDCSHTLLWDAEGNAYTPVASFGDTPEQWESIRLLKLPRAAIAGPPDRLDPGTSVTIIDRNTLDHPFAFLARRFGVAVSLCVALRVRDDIIGYLHAGYREAQRSFTAKHERIVAGIAHVASLALENARLVEELERANRFKSHFVATMSHELRTPLNVIIGYHDLLLDGTFGPLAAEQAYTLRRADRSARELMDLINATLDLSRFEARRLPLDIRDVAAGELIDEVMRETWELPDKPALSVTWNVAPDVSALRTDRVKLKMILKNLIGNAIKFTDDGSVDVEVQPRQGGVEFSVRDTGIGIAREVLTFIFEPFRQADSSTTARFGGTGLGLYIVRRLLDILGGTVRVESREGAGSTFCVWLPSDAGHDSPAR